jgi:hypothetical protein
MSFDNRAAVAFDALIMAGEAGLTRSAMFAALVAAGAATPEMNHQVVNTTVTHLRNLLSDGGRMDPNEVVTCDRASHLSTYRLALTSEDARRYRLRRAGDIKSQLETMIRQIRTERTRFAGQEVFTEAAVDYLNNALRELSRAASMVI